MAKVLVEVWGHNLRPQNDMDQLVGIVAKLTHTNLAAEALGY